MATEIFSFVSVPESEGNSFNVIQKKVNVKPFTFQIPSLRVGTLDSLMTLSEDLVKQDMHFSALAMKIARQSMELEGKDEFPSVRRSNGQDCLLDEYVKTFSWDEEKYPISRPLPELVDTLSNIMTEIDDEFKNKVSEYMAVKSQLTNIARKESGSLQVRSLEGIVNEEDVVESEHLTTLFVVVPKYLADEWKKVYATLDPNDLIVPNSSRLIEEDNENVLFSVVLFRKVVHDFKIACRDRRFNVREYEFSKEAHNTSELERENLEATEKSMWRDLVRFCKVNFAESAAGWTHLKCIRLFVESILRYGLPPKFKCVVFNPSKKEEKKLREQLLKTFGHLGGEGFRPQDMGEGASYEYYPYVTTIMLYEK